MVEGRDRSGAAGSRRKWKISHFVGGNEVRTERDRGQRRAAIWQTRKDRLLDAFLANAPEDSHGEVSPGLKGLLGALGELGEQFRAATPSPSRDIRPDLEVLGAVGDVVDDEAARVARERAREQSERRKAQVRRANLYGQARKGLVWEGNLAPKHTIIRRKDEPNK